MLKNVIKKTVLLPACLALFFLIGCDLFPGPDAIYVVATVTTIHQPSDATEARVILSKNGVPITNAEVDLNGVKCYESASGMYAHSFSPAIAAAGDVLLTIKKAGTTLNISRTLAMPFLPLNLAVTTAGSGGSYEARQPIGMRWDLVAGTPTRIDILITSAYVQSGTDFLRYVGSSVTTYAIASNTIHTGQLPPPPSSNLQVPINVVSLNVMFLAGPAFQFGSMFSVGNAAILPIYTNP